MLLTYEQFDNYIQAARSNTKAIRAIQSLGIDISKLLDELAKLVTPLENAVFNPEQQETLEWWFWDSPKGMEGNPTKPCLWDKNRNPIPLSTTQELYDYLKGLA